MFIGPLPKVPVKIPVPKLSGSLSRVGSNFITITRTAKNPEAKPSGMPIARSNNMPHNRTIEMVPISMNFPVSGFWFWRIAAQYFVDQQVLVLCLDLICQFLVVITDIGSWHTIEVLDQTINHQRNGNQQSKT